MTVTSSDGLLELVVAAIGAPGASDAGDQVFRPGDWPTQDGQYARWKVRVPREIKQSIARSGPPEFIVNTTVRLIGEVSAPAEVDNGGAAKAEAALWKLYHQLERSVIGSYPLHAQFQQIASIDAQLSYTSDAETHLAGIQVDLALEWYQGPESFAAIKADDVDELALAATNYPPAGFTAALNQ